MSEIIFKKMKVIDLCSGLGGATQAFKDRGHKVFTVDIDSKFDPDLVADIRWIKAEDFPFKPDFLWASPPCIGFSVASIWKHWKDGIMSGTVKKGITIVDACLRLVYVLKPKYWILENPRGMLRKILGKPKVTTFFASWGMPNYKPTDLWGNLPPMEWKKPTKWEKAPRGSHKGTYSIGTADLRSKIPYELSLAVCLAVEKSL
jgi:hypothetical protein